jgi:hypothetical protein
MRRVLLIIVVALAALAGSHQGWAGSPVRTDDASTTPVDESDDYQSCSQGAAPLFSDMKPADDKAWDTYMHYTPVKDGKFYDILMWGRVDACDEPRLREVLQEARPVGTISLYSGGGNLQEALAMGRTLRDFGATTLIPHDAWCASACNFIFMGGVVRMIEPGAAFLVHMFDDDAADRLRKETADPPKDLVSFLQLFPFRSGVTMQDVDDAVNDRNRKNAIVLAVLQQIDLAEEATLAPLPLPVPLRTAAASSGTTATDAEANVEDKVDGYCADQVLTDMSGNPTTAQLLAFHKQCMAIVSRPYTEADWFREEATTEYVKQLQQDGAQTAAMIARYLSEMSISLRFLTDFANSPNAAPQQLSVDDLRDLNVVNAD